MWWSDEASNSTFSVWISYGILLWTIVMGKEPYPSMSSLFYCASFLLHLKSVIHCNPFLSSIFLVSVNFLYYFSLLKLHHKAMIGSKVYACTHRHLNISKSSKSWFFISYLRVIFYPNHVLIIMAYSSKQTGTQQLVIYRKMFDLP